MNNLTLKIFGLIQVVFAAVIYVVLGDAEPIDFLEKKDFRVGIYDDSAEGGNSTIKDLGENSFEIAVGKAYEHGFAGVYFQKSDKSFFSIEDKEELQIELTSDVAAHVFIGFEKYKAGQSTRPFRLTEAINVGPGTLSKKVSLKDFKTPNWWVDANPDARKDVKLEEGIISLNIEVTGLPNNDDKAFIQITNVSLAKKDLAYRYPLAGGLFLIGMILMVYNKKSAVNIESSTDNADAPKHDNPIIYYINSNFSSRSLTINSTSEHFKLSTDYINDRVKTETEMSFKDYVNQLRVEKAKKLLKETDEKAFEISRLCGFNSSASFSQTFKAVTGITPNDFRKSK